MDTQLQDIFKNGIQKGEVTISADIWATLCDCQKKKDIRVVWKYSLVGLLPVAGLVIVVKDITTQFSQSGFYEYASLLSSDGGVVTTYWKEFVLSLTEALPLTEITVSLILMFSIIAVMRHVSYKYRNQLLVA